MRKIVAKISIIKEIIRYVKKADINTERFFGLLFFLYLGRYLIFIVLYHARTS